MLVNVCLIKICFLSGCKYSKSIYTFYTTANAHNSLYFKAEHKFGYIVLDVLILFIDFDKLIRKIIYDANFLLLHPKN